MRKLYFLFFFFLLSKSGSTQNLIPNSDFESFTSCPTFAGFDSLEYWFNPCIPPYGSGSGYSGSPDYFNSCASGTFGVPYNFAGYQSSRSGNGYIGLSPYSSSITFREYIEAPLTTTLNANQCYHFEMYVTRSDNYLLTTDTLEVYFSDTAITNLHTSDPLPFTPQLSMTSGFITDSVNWTILSGDYVAMGGESYILIGNFNDNLHTNTFPPMGIGHVYLLVDDVSLTPCTGIDDENSTRGLKIYPNPFTDNLTVETNNNLKSQIIIYNILSQKTKEQTFKNSCKINTEQFGKGVYLFEIKDQNGLLKNGKIIKK